MMNQKTNPIDAIPSDPMPDSYTLADLKKQFDLYLPYLDLIRSKGLPGAALAAKMYLTGAQTIGSSVPFTKINFDTKVFANGITVDAANHQFKIVQAGLYAIIGKICYTNSSGAAIYGAQVFINAVANAFAQQYSSSASGDQVDVILSTVLNLTGGDTVDLRGRGTSTPLNVGNESNTYFLIFKL